MVYEYTTTVDFPLVKNKNGWYVTEEAVKKMMRYYNTHYGCKAPVILEKEADENNIENNIVVGVINSTEKLVVAHHDEAKYSVKIPVLLRTDFKPDQFNQSADLSDVKTNPNNPNEIVSFRIRNIAVFPKED